MYCVRLPNRITSDTDIQILQIVVIVTHINHLRRIMFLVCVRSACCSWANHVAYTRKRRIHLRVSINNMVKLLFALFKVRFHDTNPVRCQRIILVTTIAAVIGQLVGILFADANVIHIVTIRAELHLTITNNLISIHSSIFCRSCVNIFFRATNMTRFFRHLIHKIEFAKGNKNIHIYKL